VHIGRVPVDCRSTGPLEKPAVKAEKPDFVGICFDGLKVGFLWYWGT